MIEADLFRDLTKAFLDTCRNIIVVSAIGIAAKASDLGVLKVLFVASVTALGWHISCAIMDRLPFSTGVDGGRALRSACNVLLFVCVLGPLAYYTNHAVGSLVETVSSAQSLARVEQPRRRMSAAAPCGFRADLRDFGCASQVGLAR